MTLETIQMNHRERKYCKKLNRTSVSCRKTASGLISVWLGSYKRGRDGGEQKPFEERMTIVVCNFKMLKEPMTKETWTLHQGIFPWQRKHEDCHTKTLLKTSDNKKFKKKHYRETKVSITMNFLSEVMQSEDNKFLSFKKKVSFFQKWRQLKTYTI